MFGAFAKSQQVGQLILQPKTGRTRAPTGSDAENKKLRRWWLAVRPKRFDHGQTDRFNPQVRLSGGFPRSGAPSPGQMQLKGKTRDGRVGQRDNPAPVRSRASTKHSATNNNLRRIQFGINKQKSTGPYRDPEACAHYLLHRIVAFLCCFCP